VPGRAPLDHPVKPDDDKKELDDDILWKNCHDFLRKNYD
jgi:hypothetical protein